MTSTVNLALLILGTTGALAAFGGETWRKTDEPLHKRITRRGWLALSCMLATLALGIVKEIRSNAASVEAATQQKELEANLARTTTELRDTRAKLAAVEPNILEAMVVATSGLRRESDFSTPRISGEVSLQLISGRTGSPLTLYGGDQVDYHVFCDVGAGRSAGFPFAQPQRYRLFILRVGETSYSLEEHGRQMIIGPVGQPMPAVLENPNGVRGCSLKMLIESADRTREASQLEPLLRMIREARGTPTVKESTQH